MYANTDDDLISNPSPRCACVLLLDTSSSMEGPPIEQLNEGVRILLDEIRSDDTALLSVELSIIEFGGGARQIIDFATADKIDAPRLEAAGNTPMADAVMMALGKLAERLEMYQKAGISRYRPQVILMTDGRPTDEEGHAYDGYKPTAQMLQKAALRPHKDPVGVRVCCVAIGEQANIDILKEFAHPEEPPIRISPTEFRKFFRWFSVYLNDLIHSRDGSKRPLDDW